MDKILLGNYISSYDDMVYESGPNNFKNFMSDKYNRVHNELYNEALERYYKYVLDKYISYEFLYELFCIMKNNSDTSTTLYNAIVKSNNIIIKNALSYLCLNARDYVNKAYDLIFDYLDMLKIAMSENINGIEDKDDIQDFTASYIDTSIFIRPESDETFDHQFKTYTLESDTNIVEEHNFYIGENQDYVFILENELGLKIGFNKKGKWIIILNGASYSSIEGMNVVFEKLNFINKNLQEKLKIEALQQFNNNHRVLEIKNSEYWKPSSIMIISKISPYRRQLINLSKWWNSNYDNINGHNHKDINDIKITKEKLLDSEVIEINYISGTAKMYSKTNDITYEVPFDYLDDQTVLNDAVLLTNTFLNNS